MTIPYVKIITWGWPDKSVSSSGPDYSDLTWHVGDPIPEQDIIDQHLACEIDLAVESIRVQGLQQLFDAEKRVLGTNNSNLIRLYGLKYQAAMQWLDFVNNEVPMELHLEQMLSNEASGMGVTNTQLADAIILQREHAVTQVFHTVGTIEARRRVRIFQIESATTVADVIYLRDLPVDWPDLSLLVVI